MSNERKPKKFTIDPENMTRLAVSWLAFLDDCKKQEELEKAAWQVDVEVQRQRAVLVGATVEKSDPTSDYNTYTLAWPANHPLNRFNTHWTYGNEYLALGGLKDRLTYVEKHMKEVQIASCGDDHLDYDTMQVRAKKAGGSLHKSISSGDTYYLSFDEENGYDQKASAKKHPFADFWNDEISITLGQVEYRLRYVEGVLKQLAAK